MPQLKWMEMLAKYSVTPQSEIHPFLKNKSQIDNVINNIEMDNYGVQSVYVKDINNLTLELINKEYQKVYGTTLKAINKSYTILYSFYYNRNLTRFIRLEVTEKNDQKKTINLFVVNYFAFSKKYNVKRIFMEDSNEHLKFAEYKLIKQDKLGNIIGIFKHEDKWQLIKLGNFASQRYGDDINCVILDKIDAPIHERKNIIDTSRLIDFNESFSDVDYYDLVIYTDENFIWYGRTKLSKSSSKEWEKKGFVILGNRESPTEFTNLRSLAVSSLSKKIGDKNKFFANIVVSSSFATRQGNNQDIVVNLNTNQMFSKELEYSEKPHNPPQPRKVEMNIENIVKPAFYTHYNNPEKTSFRFVNKNITLSFDLNRGDPEAINYIRASKRTYTIEIPEAVLIETIKSSGSKKIILNYEQIHKNDTSVTLKYSLVWGNTVIHTWNEVFPFLYYQGSNGIVDDPLNGKVDVSIQNIRIDFNIVVNLQVFEKIQIDANYSECFKIVVYDDEDKNDELKFNKDKIVSRIEDSSKAIVLNNNEIYIPIKKHGLWSLYLFDNGSFSFNENNIFVPSEAEWVCRINSTRGRIELVKLTNEKGQNPICAILSDGVGVTFFYKNLSISKEVNKKFYSHFHLVNYYHDLSWLVGWREQNITKFLFYEFDTKKWKIINFKINGQNFTKIHRPYIFKGLDIYNTLKEMMTPALIESTNKELCATIDEVRAEEQSLNLNFNIFPGSLMSMENLENRKREILYIKDNNNNVFWSDEFDISKTPEENLKYSAEINITIRDDDGIREKELSSLILSILGNFDNIKKFRNRHFKIVAILTPGLETNIYITAQKFLIANNSLSMSFALYFEELDPGQSIDLVRFYIGDASWDDKNHPDYLQRKNWWRRMKWDAIRFNKPAIITRNYKIDWN